jgi:hypothetical protein
LVVGWGYFVLTASLSSMLQKTDLGKIKPTQMSGFIFGGPLGPKFELF